jgi:hypothetical protein
VEVSLGCSEPTASFDTVTDLETATGLTNAVSSMALYPAGLACGLTQSAPALSIGSSKAFAVGGGQMPAPPQCADSSSFHFGFSAHATDAMGGAKGSIVIGNSNAGDCAAFGPSHVKVDVNCLSIDPLTGIATFGGPVMEATGLFAALNTTGFLAASARDNDPESQQVVDQFQFNPDAGQDPLIVCVPVRPDDIEHGNVEIHPTS